ncbi:programmed cell death protein 10 isoform X1 [Drosophila navojoa]|uniref:programmed cell death protein 10 isoform X1 n=1 Tax=Drosophila navojoa TaxID=7232 RepID=UPI0011BD502D|nr:programmed cell death protein 10 isoform X1 [Drosophila navojoa]
MTMGEREPTSSLVLPVILRPIFTQLERRDVGAAQSLRSAILKSEQNNPGFCYDLVASIVRRADLNVNLNEAVLRLQGNITEADRDAVNEYRLTRTEEPFQELNRKSVGLKVILSRIPDEINDRKTFLETIKEIASAIKKLLDVVNEIGSFIPGVTGKQAVEQRKKEFVKYSKKFSTTLKEYFKEGQPNAVFISALFLIRQTNQIMLTVKSKCE